MNPADERFGTGKPWGGPFDIVLGLIIDLQVLVGNSFGQVVDECFLENLPCVDFAVVASNGTGVIPANLVAGNLCPVEPRFRLYVLGHIFPEPAAYAYVVHLEVGEHALDSVVNVPVALLVGGVNVERVCV